MVAVSLASRHRPRRRVGARRPRGDDGRQRVVAPHGKGQRHRAHRRGHRHGGGVLHRRSVLGRVVLRPSDRPLRAAQPVHPHSRGVSGRDRCDGIRVRAVVLLSHPVLHRRRHRRRICRDQLGHRRADPGTGARSGRPHHQRDLLAGIGSRRGRGAFSSGHLELSAPTSGGASPSASAPSSEYSSFSSGAMSRRARAGCSSTDAIRKPSGSSARSRRASSGKRASRSQSRPAGL